MNTQTRSKWASRGIGHTRGIALIEALIALAVMVVGVAAIFGVHGYVVGSSAESRLQTVAMSLAQDKIEEFRNESFDGLADSVVPHEPVTIINPSIGRSQQVTLRRCWNFLEAGEDDAPAGLVDGLVQVNVTVVRDGETCTAGDRGLASLSGLLARQDPRVAALNLRDREGLDGEGEIVDVDALPQDTQDERELNPTLTPGGFEFVRDDSTGSLLAVINPETGKALVPRGGAESGTTSLAIVNLHGNLIIPGTLVESVESDVLGLGVGALGNGFCRIHYPGLDDAGQALVVFPNELELDPSDPNELKLDPDGKTINVWTLNTLPLPPKVSGVSGAYHYIRYSCVLADNWARALFPVRNGEVLPIGERICVGAPERQTDNTDNADNSAYLPPAFVSDDDPVSPATVSGTPTDELRWFGREYVGYAGVVDDGTGAFIEDADGFLERVPVGLKGSTDGVSSVIGSVCELEADPLTETCWDDETLRGWVPGGHHFFVDIDDTNDALYCAESMGLMAQIDLEQIDLGDEVPQTFYRNILFRNPGKVYCTSDKDYTIALFDRLLDEALVTADTAVRPTDCLSTTRVSGFMVNTDDKPFLVDGTETEPLPGWADIEMLSNQPFAFTGSDRSADGSVWSCGFIGGFGEAGGAYKCVFNEFAIFGDATTELDLRVRSTYKDATALSGWVPLVTNPIKDVPQDVALKSFDLQDNRCWGVTVTTESYNPGSVSPASVGPLSFDGKVGDNCETTGSSVSGEPRVTTCTLPETVGVPVGSAVTLPYIWDGSPTSVAVPVVDTCSMSVQLTAP